MTVSPMSGAASISPVKYWELTLPGREKQPSESPPETVSGSRSPETDTPWAESWSVSSDRGRCGSLPRPSKTAPERDAATGKVKAAAAEFPQDWQNSFGMKVDEHDMSTQVNFLDGYMSPNDKKKTGDNDEQDKTEP